MTTTPTGHPTPDLAARGGDGGDGERLVRRFVTVLAITVGGLCFLFSLGNVYQLAVDLELWVWIRPLVAPAVDLSLVALVVGIRFLARHGVSGKELRRPRLFLLAVGLAAWALNTAHALAERDWGKAAFDSLAPGLLLGWAEVLPWFLREFQAVTHPRAAAGRLVPIAAAPPAGDHLRIPATESPDVPAAPAVAVPPASGNGHRPRSTSPAAGDERATDASMRAHWAAARATGRTPSGAELDRVCGRDPRNGAGRKARARYLREEAAGHFHAPQPVPGPDSEPGATVPVPYGTAPPTGPGAGPVLAAGSVHGPVPAGRSGVIARPDRVPAQPHAR